MLRWRLHADCEEGDSDATDLANMLAGGDVKVVADSKSVDIQFGVPLTWTSTSRLTLDSYRSIVFRKPVTVAGTGALTIATNDGGTDGDFWFEKKGHVEFWDLSSSLIINGNSYTLVKSIRQLAKAITANPSGFYALAKSYNASKDGTYTDSPIPELDGIFDGLGNHMSRFSLSLTDSFLSAGLFGLNNGSIENLVLTRIDVSTLPSTSESVIGGLVGANYNTLRRDSISGTVQGNGVAHYAGGDLWEKLRRYN